MFDTRKRKRHFDQSNKPKRGHRWSDLGDSDFRGYQSHNLGERTQDSNLFIQAHESDLRRGPQARELAKSLEVTQDSEFDQHDPPSRHLLRPPKIGSALIHWAGGSGQSANDAFDDQEDTISLGTQPSVKSSTSVQDTSGIWVDRFDARLLLDCLPDIESPSIYATSQSMLGSPSGWSDLPSDTEETFFFSPEEAEDFRNEKRRRLFEQAQEERVKARLDEEKEETRGADEDPWGGSDEEPDDTQKEFMRRTATHLLSSPNPAQLEMRILANHGADKRFAFLKGRWSHAWLLAKAKVRAEKEEEERKEKQERVKGLGMLAGYDSGSDNDSNNAGEEARTDAQIEVTGDDEKASEAEDDMKKVLRRQRAKEWAEKRRAHASVAETNE